MNASASTRSWIAKLLILAGVVLLAVLGTGYLVLRVGFPAFIVSSASMENTLIRGDTVLVNRFATFRGRLPSRGEPVVFHFPLNRSEVYLHRIVGVPGDRLKIQNKKLYRNNVEVTEVYALHSSTLVDSYRDNFPSAPNFPLQAPAIDMLEHHVSNT